LTATCPGPNKIVGSSRFLHRTEKGNEAFILYDCKTKNGGSSRNTEFFTIEGSKIREIEVYFGSAPKEPA
jgi:hypothetical protein